MSCRPRRANCESRAFIPKLLSCRIQLSTLPKRSMCEFIGAWNGMYRTIPVEYPGPGGFNYSLFLTDATATEGANGPSLRIEKSRQGPNLEFKIYVPGAEDSKHTILLHYRVQNGLRYFNDHDELYWNVTGTDWTVPLGSVTAHVVLPAGVTGVRAAEYTGAYGSRAQDAQVDILGSNVTVQTQRPLAYREGLTLVVGWDKGFVSAPTQSDLIVQFLQSNWPLFASGGRIPVDVLAVVHARARSAGRVGGGAVFASRRADAGRGGDAGGRLRRHARHHCQHRGFSGARLPGNRRT